MQIKHTYLYINIYNIFIISIPFYACYDYGRVWFITRQKVNRKRYAVVINILYSVINNNRNIILYLRVYYIYWNPFLLLIRFLSVVFK